jgi:Spy/CpxP family protein refolding chaperone
MMKPAKPYRQLSLVTFTLLGMYVFVSPSSGLTREFTQGDIAPPRLAQLGFEEDSTALEDLEIDLGEQPQTAEAFFGPLDLTNDQKAEIIAIFNEYQPRIYEAEAEYTVAVARLSDLIAPSVPEEAIRRARTEAVVKEQVVYDLLFDRSMAIREVLSVDQRTEIGDSLRALLDLGPANPQVVFPLNLIGTDVNDTIATLVDQGWVVLVRTPGSVELNQGQQGLNLDISQGVVQDATLVAP